MDIGLTPRPVASVGTPVRTEPLPPPDAVATDLPPAAAVTASPDAAQVRVDLSRGSQSIQDLEVAVRETIKRNLLLDPETRQVVYKAVDTRSGQTVEQIPDEALLKLRAYVRANAQAGEAKPSAEMTA
ncbi:hypothetical protein ABEG18_16250 [Alsobacter sp. KACC 23698]|uniref:Flagellar protein FlaG n=1 Tax=Alsobacter sp. KACC 23698 TaxID=3149229 RepID=A0AAU7JAZ1_9HYPH